MQKAKEGLVTTQKAKEGSVATQEAKEEATAEQRAKNKQPDEPKEEERLKEKNDAQRRRKQGQEEILEMKQQQQRKDTSQKDSLVTRENDLIQGVLNEPTDRLAEAQGRSEKEEQRKRQQRERETLTPNFLLPGKQAESSPKLVTGQHREGGTYGPGGSRREGKAAEEKEGGGLPDPFAPIPPPPRLPLGVPIAPFLEFLRVLLGRVRTEVELCRKDTFRPDPYEIYPANPTSSRLKRSPVWEALLPNVSRNLRWTFEEQKLAAKLLRRF
ncbi:cilia- and flagella-associated protein 251-like isoform X2 [Varroa destructor]|uniref:Uncharacterized protein n=2 Tax=Varroa TaxID=62624 RepID=A0A7M7KYU8_VARDE|nr:cilia- and flagella-associated protein 251-like isoform X2 [Varroa destructor]